MCRKNVTDWVIDHLSPGEVLGKHVLEVGSVNINGSVRPGIMAMKPLSYIGMDIEPQQGFVDVVCDAEVLLDVFDAGVMDIVISTEVLEHVKDWRKVIQNMKDVLKPGGLIILTTRAPGYPYHDAPEDHWRYDEKHMRAIFADYDIQHLYTTSPGSWPHDIFVKAVKPLKPSPSPVDLSEIHLEEAPNANG